MKQASAGWPAKIVGGAILMYAVSAASSIFIAEICVVLASLVWLGGAHRELGKRLPLVWPLGAFLVSGAFTAALAPDHTDAFFEVGGDWMAAIFFLVCVNSLGAHESEPRLTGRVRLLIGATAVSALYAISQVFTEGIDFRVQGFLGHYNTLGGVLSLVALLAGAQLLFHFRGRRDLWLVVALLILLVALTLTQSRAAIGGFLLGAAVLVAWRDRRFLLLVPLLGVVVVLIAPGNLKSRVVGVLDLSDVTARERLYMWKAGAEMFRAHPLTGVGPGAAGPLYDRFKHPDDPWIHPDPPWHLHSNLVHLGAERGLLGTLPWVLLWLAFLRRTYDIYRRLAPDDPGARALVCGSLACAVAFLSTGMVDYNQGDSEVVLAMVFTMALPFAVEPAEAVEPGVR